MAKHLECGDPVSAFKALTVSAHSRLIDWIVEIPTPGIYSPHL